VAANGDPHRGTPGENPFESEHVAEPNSFPLKSLPPIGLLHAARSASAPPAFNARFREHLAQIAIGVEFSVSHSESWDARGTVAVPPEPRLSRPRILRFSV
jgi:hypothetical protein